MKTLYKYYLIFFFPICANGQVSAFQSTVNQPFYNFFSDSIVSYDYDTTKYLSINSRLFSIGSASKSDYSSTHLFGASLLSNFNNNVIFILDKSPTYPIYCSQLNERKSND